MKDNKTNQDRKSEQCCSGSSKKCSCTAWLLLIIAIFICAYVGHKHCCSKKYDMAAFETYKKENIAQMEFLKKEILKLKAEINEITSKTNFAIGDRSAEEVRNKWKTWMALRSKIEENSSFNGELEKFRATFEKDQELIRLVDALVREANPAVIKIEGENKFWSICKMHLKKLVKCKKVDHTRLEEIAGYVLSSAAFSF
jgi:hypothetical protein